MWIVCTFIILVACIIVTIRLTERRNRLAKASALLLCYYLVIVLMTVLHDLIYYGGKTEDEHLLQVLPVALFNTPFLLLPLGIIAVVIAWVFVLLFPSSRQ